MKITSFTTLSITTTLLASFVLSTPISAHASIFSDGFIVSQINAGKENTIQNRDNRNQLLEKVRANQMVKPPTAEERQAVLLQQLSLMISNLHNIQTRIETRTAAEAADGHDITDLENFLSAATDELALASSSVAAIATSTPSTNPYDTRMAIVNAINQTNAAKSTLQQALNTLERVL